ncbi:metallophosphatase family protein [Alistipes sp. OttesenSCG-928-B03]|nr:metallophosphatase family protein [Alistipes sp. OttesenSCG-928-B03]
MKRIGIISDTHGCFDDRLRRFLADVDEVWHAGDFGSIEVADTIAAFKPLRGVYGNIDGGTTRIVYPEVNVFECEGVRVMMTHIGGYPGRYDPRAYAQMKRSRPGILVAGHSHILKVQYDRTNDLLFINPGAAGLSGFHKVRTAVRLSIDGADIRDLEVGEWPRNTQ